METSLTRLAGGARLAMAGPEVDTMATTYLAPGVLLAAIAALGVGATACGHGSESTADSTAAETQQHAGDAAAKHDGDVERDDETDGGEDKDGDVNDDQGEDGDGGGGMGRPDGGKRHH